MKEIVIEGPIFYGEEDENLFFQCIYDLPNFIEVIGKGKQLKISFSAPVSIKARDQLEALCHRWNTGIHSS